MRKIIMDDLDLERVNELTLPGIEIVFDEYYPDKVELYMVDHNSHRIEGGTFDLNAFMDHVREFYNKNY